MADDTSVDGHRLLHAGELNEAGTLAEPCRRSRTLSTPCSGIVGRLLIIIEQMVLDVMSLEIRKLVTHLPYRNELQTTPRTESWGTLQLTR